MTSCLVILGAAGDLTARYLLPALARLHEAKKLPPGLSILGVARNAWDTETFHRHIAEQAERNRSPLQASAASALSTRGSACLQCAAPDACS
jgi:glucose-6-phosphate 1-dehydrogenase